LGLVLWPQAIDDATRIWSVVLGTLALSLDGLDGWLARRTSTESAFGARFDMESDAALLMVLSVLAWRADQAGVWVLGIGLMRYAFVAAAWAWPWMNGELPPSMRRKVICVVQGVALLIALAPFTPAVLGAGVLAVALATLTWSFAIDTGWLARHRPK
jgi:phosphatidylglycerophosphate synthase